MSDGRAQFLEAAVRIGRRLCRDAIWAEGRCNWLGWAMEARRGQLLAVYRAMGSQLYDGTAGIGLFLVHLARITRDPIIRATAEGALAQALTAVDQLSAAGEYGFYAGLSGIAWCCIEAGEMLEHEALRRRGTAALLRAAKLPVDPHRLDVINGSAGLIPVLLEAATRDPSEVWPQAAVRHGEHLLSLAAQAEMGRSWDTFGVPGEKHLLGFAHGASGIACALAELAAACRQQAFRDAALEGLRYEHSYFRPAEGNWPDLRSFTQPSQGGEPGSMIAWCHGAPGIGFARLRTHFFLPEEPSVLPEAEVAIATTAATLTQGAAGVGNMSLCHGDGGNLDLLILAADMLDRPELRRHAEAAGSRAIEQFEDRRLPWLCGVPNAAETPNLLLGLAGIGYFFLRLYDSKEVPTVLLPGARSSNRTSG